MPHSDVKALWSLVVFFLLLLQLPWGFTNSVRMPISVTVVNSHGLIELDDNALVVRDTAGDYQHVVAYQGLAPSETSSLEGGSLLIDRSTQHKSVREYVISLPCAIGFCHQRFQFKDNEPLELNLEWL